MIALFKHLLALRGIEYLTLDRHLKVMQWSTGVSRYLDSSLTLQLGVECCLILPELIGCEADLAAVAIAESPQFQLNAIARSVDTSACIYFNLYALKHEAEFFPGSSVILFIEDVTEQLQLEQRLVQGSNEQGLLLSALESAQAYTDHIISSMADALIVTSRDGTIKRLNAAASSMLGYYSQELIGQSLSRLVDDSSFVPEVIQPQSLSPTATLQDEKVVCCTKSGEKITVSFSCSAVPTSIEGVYDYLYIGRDITEFQRSQQRFMAQYTISGVLSRSSTLATAIATILPTLCQSLEWDIVELWMPEDQLNLDTLQVALNSETYAAQVSQLRCVEIWSRLPIAITEFIDVTQKMTFLPDVGLPGKVWTTKAPVWLQDVVDQADFMRIAIAAKAGLHTGFGFPILSGDQVLGVVTFFSREIRKSDLALLSTMMVIGNQLGEFIQRKRTELSLFREQRRTEHLLSNVLPKSIVEQLKQEQGKIQCNNSSWQGIAEHFEEATVLFADLVGFTELTTRLPATQLVNLLNQIFSAFDRLTERHGLEKIKTIGDAYMVVGGVPDRRVDHAEAVANMALDMQVELDRFNLLNQQSFSMRIGIHTGAVIAGVIGIKKFIYDLWGDTVNTASRMESHGIAGQIQVSAATYEQLRTQYVFQERGKILIKSKGEMTTYLLIKR